MGTNQHEVDQDRIDAELEAVAVPDSPPGASQVGPGPSGAGAPSDAGQLAPAPSSWAPATPMLVLALDRGVCPNWKLSADEKRELEEALAAVLDQLFPGGMGDERWAPYIRLVAVAGGIAAARFHEGRFTPLRAPTVDGEGGEGGASPASAGARQFTTGGGGASH